MARFPRRRQSWQGSWLASRTGAPPYVSPLRAAQGCGRLSWPALTRVAGRARSLRIERNTCEELRAENARLTHDIRSIAGQLKQERAASNAVLAVQVGGGSAAADRGYVSQDESLTMSQRSAESDGHGAAVDTNGLTLASAASQVAPPVARRWQRAGAHGRVESALGARRPALPLLPR
jgi:hypothetical protein